MPLLALPELVANKITIRTPNMMSLVNDIAGVSGKQSPKHPQVLILPENKAYPVRKVKNSMRINKSHVIFLVCQFTIMAIPANTSSTFMPSEENKLNGFKKSKPQTSKNSCIL